MVCSRGYKLLSGRCELENSNTAQTIVAAVIGVLMAAALASSMYWMRRNKHKLRQYLRSFLSGEFFISLSAAGELWDFFSGWVFSLRLLWLPELVHNVRLFCP